MLDSTKFPIIYVMKKMVFIACSSKKHPRKTKAKELYTSTLFKLSLAFARTLQPDNIFILSAKHGLVELEQELKPYEQTLNTMPVHKVKNWAENVREQMETKGIDFKNDEIVFLAGEKYRKYILPHLQNVYVPLQGMRIGEQLQYLKNKVGYGK